MRLTVEILSMSVLLMSPAGWWAWRVGEKRRKRLAQKMRLNRILGKV